VQRRLDRARHAIPSALGAVTFTSVVLLLAWDANPALFTETAHRCLAAFPLTMIAIAYLIHQTARGPRVAEFLQAVLLAAAFLFWAANQFWPDLRQATLFNDIAIALFVIDVLIVMAGRNGPRS